MLKYIFAFVAAFGVIAGYVYLSSGEVDLSAAFVGATFATLALYAGLRAVAASRQ